MFVVLTFVCALLCSLGRAENGGCQTNDECEDHEECFPNEGVCGDLWVNCQSPDTCGKNGSCTILNHEVVCLANKTECHSHEDCSKDKMCFSNTCLNPCLNNICGKNTTCRVRDNDMFCDCLPGHVRVNLAAVTSACRVPDCVQDADCHDNKVCRQGRCQISACAGKCGPKTQCIVSTDNSAVCTCKPGYSGLPDDKSIGCQLVCSTHSHCPGSNMCVLDKCIDLCKHNVCGDNSTCNIEHNKLSCNNIEVEARVATDFVSKEQRPRVKSAELSVDLWYKDGVSADIWVRELSLSLQTREVAVELTKLVCDVDCVGSKLFTCNTTIMSQTHNTTLAQSSTPSDWDIITISTEEKPLVLRLHTLYNITLSCDTEFRLVTLPSPRYTEPHFDIQLPPYRNKYSTPLEFIKYKTLTFL